MFFIDLLLSESYAYSLFVRCERPSPILKFKESDFDKSIGKEGLLLNQKCFFAYNAVNLSDLFFKSLATRSLAAFPYFYQTASSNSYNPLSIFLMVSSENYD